MPDAVVIGAGHNGLVAANLLADEGLEVLVLERNGEAGGAVRTGELTLPGFRHDLFSAFYPLAAVSPVLSSLGLEAYGLTWRHAPLVLASTLPGGRSVAVSRRLEETVRSLEADHQGDGARWEQMMQRWHSVRDGVVQALFSPFPPVRAGAGMLRRLGPSGLVHFARDLVLPVRRMGEEWFGGEAAALLLGASALHADLPPESAGSGGLGFLLACLAQDVGFPVPEGGAGALTGALVARLRRRGGEVHCRREVSRVVVRRGRAVAVRTADGDEIEARAVLANVSAPALYLRLVGSEHLPASFLADVRSFHWDAATVKVDWALSAPVPWGSEEVGNAGTVHIADGLDELTEHAAALATRRLPARPFLVFGQQAKADPSRAPIGCETAWAYTHVARELRGDAGGELDVGGDAWVPGFVDRIERRVEEHAPGFRDRILARHVFGPGQFGREDPNLDRGAVNGGTSQLHQQLVFRPVPGWGRAETPVAGLYLASASAHPGGGVHGAPGANAARAALASAPRLRAAVFGRGGVGALTGRRSGGAVEER